MFAFHPCDRCQFSLPDSVFCRKGFNQFKTNERYLSCASKVIHIPALCYKFKYIKEPVKTFEELFRKHIFFQQELF